MTTLSTMSASSTTTSDRLSVKEEDVIKLACEFLQNRQLHISQVSNQG